MMNRFLAGFLFFCTTALFAQSGTPSPYSFYGIGDVTYRGNVENRSMGGIGTISDSIHINLQNPASFSTIKRTALTVGATHTQTDFKTNTSIDKGNSTNLTYLAVGIPMGKFGAGIGLLPYSSVGYRLQAQTDEGFRRYYGEGGVNRTFFSLSYAYNNDWSFGASFHYDFGQISTKTSEYLNAAQFGAREDNDSDISGSGYVLGVNYHKKYKKYDYFASLVYTARTKLDLTNNRRLATVSYSSSSGESIVDSQELLVNDTSLKLPSELAFGVGIGAVRKWVVAVEAALSSGASGNRFDDIQGAGYRSGGRYSLGGYYIPRYDAYRGYFNRVVYRAGLRYEDTGLTVAGKDIEDLAVTFGFGFPVRGSFTSINLGVEMGRRGTKAEGLIQENYTKISLSLSFSDLWFQKQKID